MSRTQRLSLLAAIMGSFVVGLDSTVVNVALPVVERELGGGLAGQQGFRPQVCVGHAERQSPSPILVSDHGAPPRSIALGNGHATSDSGHLWSN